MELKVVKVYGVETPIQEPELLTQQQAIDAFNLLKEGKSLNYVRHTFAQQGETLSRAKLHALFVKLCMIRDMVERIMLGKAKVQYEEGHWETDPETQEQTWVIDQPVMYASIPNSMEELKQTAIEVIENDESVDISLFQGTLQDLLSGLYYVIEEVVKYSKEDKQGTFEWFKANVE